MEYPFKDLLPLDEVLAREGYYKDWTHLDPEVFYSLTQISEYIKTKGYGVDVRLLIAQLAEHFGLKTTQVVDLANLLSTKHDALKAQFDVVIRDATSGADWGGEIVLARGGKATLGQRLDETTAQLEQNATQITTIQNELIKGEDGKKYKIVSAILRNTGAGWSLVTDDDVHKSVNIASVTQTADRIIVNFDFMGKLIGTFICGLDETFASMGLYGGASVGKDRAEIEIYQKEETFGAYIYYDGYNWQILGDNSGNLVVQNFTEGILNLSHQVMQDSSYLGNVTARNGLAVPVLGSLASTSSQISFVDNTGVLITAPNTNMKAYFTRTRPFRKLAPSSLVSQTGNFWCFGIFEID